VGAVNVARARRRGLTGRARWQAFEAALRPPGATRLAVTVELIFGQAWGRGQSRRGGEVTVPVSRIGRRSEST
jgi:hypothetical protein